MVEINMLDLLSHVAFHLCEGGMRRGTPIVWIGCDRSTFTFVFDFSFVGYWCDLQRHVAVECAEDTVNQTKTSKPTLLQVV